MQRKARLILLGLSLEALKVLAVLIFAVFLGGMCHKAKADDLPQSEWIKGGVVTGFTNDGKCVFKAFVKTADTSDDRDTGEPQILGYSPGNVYIDRHGKVVWERVNENLFFRLREMKSIHGRMCRCPDFNE